MVALLPTSPTHVSYPGSPGGLITALDARKVYEIAQQHNRNRLKLIESIQALSVG